MPVLFVPFPGDFFSIGYASDNKSAPLALFVPFPGDFFSIISVLLSTELLARLFVPFPGDFFSIKVIRHKSDGKETFRPLSRGLFFNSVPAKPQPVCSRECIRGGDGEIASSGTLLRR